MVSMKKIQVMRLSGLVVAVLLVSQVLVYHSEIRTFVVGSISPQTSVQTASNDERIKGAEITSAEEIKPESLYLLINAYRKEHKLSPLIAHPTLEISAQRKLKDMVDNKYFRHLDAQDGQTWYMLTNAGYHYKKAGENLSFGYNSPWQVLQAWIESDSHNRQLLDGLYVNMGLAADCTSLSMYADGGCIIVLHLGLQ